MVLIWLNFKFWYANSFRLGYNMPKLAQLYSCFGHSCMFFTQYLHSKEVN